MQPFAAAEARCFGGQQIGFTAKGIRNACTPAHLCASSAVRRSVLRVERLVEVVGILGGLWVVEHRVHAEHNVRAWALALRGDRLCAVHNLVLQGCA